MSEVETKARELFRAACLKGELEPTEERWERGKERFTKKAQYAIARETKRSIEEKRNVTTVSFVDDLNKLTRAYNAEIYAGYDGDLVVQFTGDSDKDVWEHWLEFDRNTREYHKL